MKFSVIRYRLLVWFYMKGTKSMVDAIDKMDAARKAVPYSRMKHSARIDAFLRYR